MKTVKKSTSKKSTAIICNKSYGIYYGEVVSFDANGGVAKVRSCRHVCHWRGREGGITSLAAFGLCGPDAGLSRIGAAAPGVSTLTGIVNVFPCSPEAAATIEAAGAK